MAKRKISKFESGAFLSIARPAELLREADAKAKAEALQSGDDSWAYSANLVNPEKGLWEVRWTDEDGYSERI